METVLKRSSCGGQLKEGSTPASRRTTRGSTAGQARPRSAFGEAPDDTAGILNKALQLGTALPLCAAAQAATILTIAPTGIPTPAIGPATPDIAVDEEASTSDQCCAIRTEELPHASAVATSASAASDCSATEGGEDDLSSSASRTTRSSNGASGEETDLSSAASEVVAEDHEYDIEEEQEDDSRSDLTSHASMDTACAADMEIQSTASCEVVNIDIINLLKACTSDLEVPVDPPSPLAPGAAKLPSVDTIVYTHDGGASERTCRPNRMRAAHTSALELPYECAVLYRYICRLRSSTPERVFVSRIRHPQDQSGGVSVFRSNVVCLDCGGPPGSGSAQAQWTMRMEFAETPRQLADHLLVETRAFRAPGLSEDDAGSVKRPVHTIRLDWSGHGVPHPVPAGNSRAQRFRVPSQVIDWTARDLPTIWKPNSKRQYVAPAIAVNWGPPGCPSIYRWTAKRGYYQAPAITVNWCRAGLPPCSLWSMKTRGFVAATLSLDWGCSGRPNVGQVQQRWSVLRKTDPRFQRHRITVDVDWSCPGLPATALWPTKKTLYQAPSICVDWSAFGLVQAVTWPVKSPKAASEELAVDWCGHGLPISDGLRDRHGGRLVKAALGFGRRLRQLCGRLGLFRR
eukprot:jgi/Ulvmu1/8330/UM042_0036.1